MSIKKVILGFTLLSVLSFVFLSCSKNEQSQKELSVAIFIPGVVSENAVYEMFVAGSEKAIQKFTANEASPKVNYQIIEAGTNQSEWPGKLTALCASEKWDLIFSSNPALPDILEPILKSFPKQHCIILDSYKPGINTMQTILYNQRQQAYLAGYAAAMVTTAKDLEFANTAKKIALIAAQEYPAMNDIILPGFIEGAKAYDSEIEVLFRIVGNWFDASKGYEIASALYDSGVDVILPIAGGASQGVLSCAKDKGFYVSWFDNEGYEKAPGYVISSAMMMQEKMAEGILQNYLEGKADFSSASIYGMEDGFIDFVLHSPASDNPERLEKLTAIYEAIKEKRLVLEPSL